MKQCKHPTCATFCRRVKPVKKRQPIKRKPYKIRYHSKKNEPIYREYAREAKIFRKENPVYQIRSPECEKITQGVHHVKGRGKFLMVKKYWMAACNACNGYVERHHAWAVENGFKESRLKNRA